MFFLAGLLLFGKGLTGLYILDFKQPPCDEDKDCAKGEACCYFYKENFGVCDKKSECAAIESVTFNARHSTYYLMEKTEKYKLFSMTSKHLEGPSKQSSLYSAVAGLLLILVAIFGFLVGKLRDIHAGKSRGMRSKGKLKEYVNPKSIFEK